MRRTILGTVAGLWLAGLAGLLTASLGPSSAPHALLVSLAMALIGAGLLLGGGLSGEGRREVLVQGTAALVALLSLTWGGLLRLGHALLAGTDLAAPPWVGLLSLALVPVGLPAFLLGLAASVEPAEDPRARWRRLLGGAAAGTLLGSWLGHTFGWRIPVAAAGALLAILALAALRRGEPAETERPSDPVLPLLATAGFGLGAGLLLRGLWRGWEILQAFEAWTYGLGAVILLAAAALAPNGRARRGGLAAPLLLGASVLLLPAWPFVSRFLSDLFPPEGGGNLVGGLLLGCLLLAPAAVATGAVFSRRCAEVYVERGLGALLAGAGIGWAVAAFLLVPAVGFGRTAGLGACLAVVAALGGGIGRLVASAAGLAAVVVALLWPATLTVYEATVNPAAEARVLEARETPSSTVVVREGDEGEVRVFVAGRLLGQVGWAGMADRLMAGHLPVLLREGLQQAHVVATADLSVARSLAAHGLETRVRRPAVLAGLALEVTEPELPSPGGSVLDGAGDASGTEEPPRPEIQEQTSGPVGYLPPGIDLVVTLLPDPTHPFARPVFTEGFYASAAKTVGEDGLLVQLVDLEGLSVEEIHQLLRRAARSFPHVDLWSFEAGAGGEFLLVAARSPLILPYERLLPSYWEGRRGDGPRRLRYDLERAALDGEDDLIHGLALRVAAGDATPTLPSPEGPVAGGEERARRVVYGEQSALWRIDHAFAYRKGYQSFLPLDLSTRLTAWEEGESTLTAITQLAAVPGIERLGLYRELLPDVTVEGETRSLRVRGTPMVLPNPNEVIAPLVESGRENLVRSGQSTMHGHPAPWYLKQDPAAARDQELLMVWFCPVQGTRYFLSLRTVEGSPGRADPLVAWVTETVSCRHPGEPTTDRGRMR